MKLSREEWRCRQEREKKKDRKEGKEAVKLFAIIMCSAHCPQGGRAEDRNFTGAPVRCGDRSIAHCNQFCRGPQCLRGMRDAYL